MSYKIEKHIKSILPEPEKRDFYELLHRAVRKGDKVSSQKQKRKKGGNYNDK